MGLLILGPRTELRQPWLWLGALVAVLVGAPNLIFQLANGWPSLDVAAALTDNNGSENRATFVPFQLILLGPLLVPIMIIGFVGLLRDERWRPVRGLSVAYLVAAVVVLATGGRPDYVVPLVLLAAGCVRVERVRLAALGLAVNGLVTAVIALPLIPVSAVGSTPVPGISQLVRDSIGWPQFADQVAAVYRSLPPEEQATTIVITNNYGEAGALHRFGPPALRVYSGQNHLYHGGPPPESVRTVILVGLHGATRLFTACDNPVRIDNTFGVDNEEQGRPIELCHDPTEPWQTTWPGFQHYD